MTDGWRGSQRGVPQSFFDIETAAPGTANATWLGYQLRTSPYGVGEMFGLRRSKGG